VERRLLHKIRKIVLSWTGLAAIAVIAAVAWLGLRGLPDGKLHIYFLDVGQGDAIFIQAPDGRQVLVDGGPNPISLFNQLSEVMPFWDRSIDMVVLTHADSDHINGLLALPDRYRVRQVIATAQAETAPLAAAWLDTFEHEGMQPIHAERGMQMMIGNAVLTVLNPGEEPVGAPLGADEDNENSIVLRLDHGAMTFLLTGDADATVEKAILELGLPLRADVLKAGHHGSSGATSLEFVAAVQPQIVVFQVGAGNRFGHPSEEVLGRVSGSRIFRTDTDGRVEVVSDGHSLRVEP
jgi:competence protein ComEC